MEDTFFDIKSLDDLQKALIHHSGTRKFNFVDNPKQMYFDGKDEREYDIMPNYNLSLDSLDFIFNNSTISYQMSNCITLCSGIIFSAKRVNKYLTGRIQRLLIDALAQYRNKNGSIIYLNAEYSFQSPRASMNEAHYLFTLNQHCKTEFEFLTFLDGKIKEMLYEKSKKFPDQPKNKNIQVFKFDCEFEEENIFDLYSYLTNEGYIDGKQSRIIFKKVFTGTPLKRDERINWISSKSSINWFLMALKPKLKGNPQFRRIARDVFTYFKDELPDVRNNRELGTKQEIERAVRNLS